MKQLIIDSSCYLTGFCAFNQMSTNFMLILKLVIFMQNKKTVFIFFINMNLMNINNELQLWSDKNSWSRFKLIIYKRKILKMLFMLYRQWIIKISNWPKNQILITVFISDISSRKIIIWQHELASVDRVFINMNIGYKLIIIKF